MLDDEVEYTPSSLLKPKKKKVKAAKLVESTKKLYDDEYEAEGNIDREAIRAKVLAIKNEINKKFKDEVVLLGSEVTFGDYGKLPTGNFAMDIAIGGGIFVGGIISVSGPESSGKTVDGFHFVAQCQKRGLVCLWVAVEPFDANWASQNGVDTDLLLVVEPSGAEEGLQVAIDCQWRDDVDVVVIDSVEALEPTKEREKDFEDTMQMGIKQKLLGEYLRKFRALNNWRKRRARDNPNIRPLTLFLINQLREKPTVYGDPEYEPGGRALRHYTDIAVRLRNKGNIYYSPSKGIIYPGESKPKDAVPIGITIAGKVHKNKTYRKDQTFECDFYFDKGGPVPPGHFDNVKAVIMEGLAWGVIKRPTTQTYQFEDIKVVGQANLIRTLREDEKLVNRIKEAVIEKMTSSVRVVSDDEDDEE